MEKYESPQEEALEISLIIRKKILNKEEDITSVLRNCLVVANNLSKENDIFWIKKEMNSYQEKDELPSYRKFPCYIIDNWGLSSNKQEESNIRLEVGLILEFLRDKKDIKISTKDENKIIVLDPPRGFRIIEKLTNRCLDFLNICISELQYGGYVQSFFEEIRKNVDKKISKIDNKCLLEIQSIVLDLKSSNSQDWPKVALSCRKILLSIADKVFPASDEKYKTKDGREWDIKEGNFLNRLLCYFDKNDFSKIGKAEIEMMEKYFRVLVGDTQDSVHKNIGKNEASLLALHTYLILSEVLDKLDKDIT